jgi:hypothetical protein
LSVSLCSLFVRRFICCERLHAMGKSLVSQPGRNASGSSPSAAVTATAARGVLQIMWGSCTGPVALVTGCDVLELDQRRRAPPRTFDRRIPADDRGKDAAIAWRNNRAPRRIAPERAVASRYITGVMLNATSQSRL